MSRPSGARLVAWSPWIYAVAATPFCLYQLFGGALIAGAVLYVPLWIFIRSTRRNPGTPLLWAALGSSALLAVAAAIQTRNWWPIGLTFLAPTLGWFVLTLYVVQQRSERRLFCGRGYISMIFQTIGIGFMALLFTQGPYRSHAGNEMAALDAFFFGFCWFASSAVGLALFTRLFLEESRRLPVVVREGGSSQRIRPTGLVDDLAVDEELA